MNYAELDDSALQRVIAERLGYRQTDEYDGWFGNYWCAPDGYLALDGLPDWPNSVDAALELWKPAPSGLQRLVISIGANTRVDPYGLTLADGLPVYAIDKETARAICLAWLEWMDAKEKDVSG